MSGHRRTERINELLRRELSRLVREELKDPRVRTVTVTEVVTAPDLTQATVYVRTLDAEVPAPEAVEGLTRAAGFIRRRLGKLLHLRRVPEFRFQTDSTLERASRIEELLQRARAEETGDAEDEVR